MSFHEECKCDLPKSPLLAGNIKSRPSRLKVAEIVLWKELAISLQLQFRTKQKTISSLYITKMIVNATHAQKSAVSAYTTERRMKNLKPK